MTENTSIRKIPYIASRYYHKINFSNYAETIISLQKKKIENEKIIHDLEGHTCIKTSIKCGCAYNDYTCPHTNLCRLCNQVIDAKLAIKRINANRTKYIKDYKNNQALALATMADKMFNNSIYDYNIIMIIGELINFKPTEADKDYLYNIIPRKI